VSAGRDDAFVAKLDAAGSVLWSQRLGGADHDTDWRVAVDLDGNVLVAGTFEGTAGFGTGSLSSTGGHDAFVTKLDAAGVLLWSLGFGGTGEDDALDLVVDAAGRAFVTGTTSGGIDFGLGSVCAHGGTDAYLVGVNADGSLAWGHCYGMGFDEAGTGLALAPDGELVLAGKMGLSVNFGSLVYCPAVGYAVLVGRCTTAGEALSGQCYDGELNQFSTNVAVDPWGNVIVIGYFAGELSFGTGELDTCAFDEPGDHEYNGLDLFVAKLTP